MSVLLVFHFSSIEILVVLKWIFYDYHHITRTLSHSIHDKYDLAILHFGKCILNEAAENKHV